MSLRPAPEDLAGALAARVAHDIAGAMSGLSAALSLLDEPDPALRDEAAALARQAMAELEARLAWCRAAYGRSAETTDPAALARMIGQTFASTRGSVEVQIEPTELRTQTGQVALALTQIALGACAAGGQARLQVRGGDAWSCELAVRGPHARLGPEAKAGLTGEAIGEGPAGRWALGAFVAALCRRDGGEVSVDETPEGFSVKTRGAG